jgi:hypothetical protein
MKQIQIQLVLLCLSFTLSIQAQVNMGGSLQTTCEPAALLQIKEYDASPGVGDKTADKGILLPRVSLNSLSDITVITDKDDADKKASLTGLLVYNVNTVEMEAGIYEWDGDEWVQLEILSEKEGAYTKRTIKTTLSANDLPIVSIGRFDFGFSSELRAIDRSRSALCSCHINENEASITSLAYRPKDN